MHGLACFCTNVGDTFAEWRWGSLARWRRSIRRFRACMEVGFVLARYRLTPDAVRAAAMLASCTAEAEEFWYRVECIHVCFGLVEELRTWGGGCSCHEAERVQGLPFHCDLAGRRAPDAWDRVQRCLAELDRTAASAARQTFGHAAELVGTFVTCCAALKGIVLLKMQYMDRDPFLIVRARSPDVARATLTRHDAAVRAGRVPHRIIRHFCAFASPLWRDFEALAACQGCSDRRSTELQPYAWCLLDESRIEGEHRSLRQESQRAHGVGHAFAASTLRHPQQIAMLSEARDHADRSALFERCWRSRKLTAAHHSFVPGPTLRVPRTLRAQRATTVVGTTHRLGQAGLVDGGVLSRSSARQASTP